jgi:hypothetical protein
MISDKRTHGSGVSRSGGQIEVRAQLDCAEDSDRLVALDITDKMQQGVRVPMLFDGPAPAARTPHDMRMHWKVACDGIKYPAGDGTWVTMTLDEARAADIPGVRACFGEASASTEPRIVGGSNLSRAEPDAQVVAFFSQSALTGAWLTSDKSGT